MNVKEKRTVVRKCKQIIDSIEVGAKKGKFKSKIMSTQSISFTLLDDTVD